MAKVLKLFNTFTRTLNQVEIGGKTVARYGQTQPSFQVGSFYICGPTVYSDCHVGHALTYIRSDLFRRFMKFIFDVRLVTVMNITDIDDKILHKTQLEYGPSGNYSSDPTRHSFNSISQKYFESFRNDIHTIRVQPADLIIKVSKNVDLIVNFIKKLESEGYAYIAPNKDVIFNVTKVMNYKGRIDPRVDHHGQNSSNLSNKFDSRDFVLWKSFKPNEPIWVYDSSVSGERIPGRPGWHVQCSAIASSIFGNKLDFHYGGKDLIFPHNYNEEACCCAFHNLDTSLTLHSWVKNWLHSGHLIIKQGSKDEKMSKSLGNVIPIKSFIDRSSVNALRLLCILSHYRTNIDYNNELLDKIKGVDHRISAFNSYLADNLKISSCDEYDENSCDLESAIQRTHEDIVDGICDDFDTNRGLNSILELSKIVYNVGADNVNLRDLVATWTLLKDWCQACGLEYGLQSSSSSQDSLMYEIVRDFRNKVRVWTIDEMRHNRKSSKSETEQLDSDKSINRLNDLMRECDKVRELLGNLGFVERDQKTK